MKFKLSFYNPFNLRMLVIGALMSVPLSQTLAQHSGSKKHKPTVSVGKKRTTYTIPSTASRPNTESSGPNRLDVCIERNRRLVTEISALNELLSKQATQLLNGEGVTNYYKMTLKIARDSVQLMQRRYNDLLAANANSSKVFKDSLESYNQLKSQISRDKQKMIRDSNVVRVYNLPYDQVRVKVLRKVLDDGLGLVIERNTDEGFLVSKIFKDRKSKGMFKKVIDTKVDCDIRMVQHPYQDNKTLFYATTRVQESNGNNSFVELTDPVLIKEYQKKLLKFFDDFLVTP